MRKLTLSCGPLKEVVQRLNAIDARVLDDPLDHFRQRGIRDFRFLGDFFELAFVAIKLPKDITQHGFVFFHAPIIALIWIFCNSRTWIFI